MSSPGICPSCGAFVGDADSCQKCGVPILQGLDVYEKLVEVGEKTIKDDPRMVEFCLQTIMSAYVCDPGNLAPEAPSSEGKTYGVVETAKLFPKEDVWLLGGLSPTAIANDRGILVDESDNPVEPRLEALYQEAEVEKANYGI